MSDVLLYGVLPCVAAFMIFTVLFAIRYSTNLKYKIDRAGSIVLLVCLIYIVVVLPWIKIDDYAKLTFIVFILPLLALGTFVGEKIGMFIYEFFIDDWESDDEV